MRVFHLLLRRAETVNLDRPRVRDRRVGVAALILVLSASFATAQNTDREGELNRALAADLVAEAGRLQRSGDVDTARAIARRALTIDPRYAPARLRAASFLSEDQAATRRHVTLLESALTGTLSPEERREAVILLARAYLRTGEPDRARTLLEGEILRDGGENLVLSWRGSASTDAARGGSDPGRADLSGADALDEAEILFLQSVTDGAGRWRSAEFLRDTRRRFPTDLRVAAVDWNRHNSLSLEALEWLDAVPHSAERAFVDILRRFALLSPNEDLRRTLAYRYYALGGTDPLPYVMVAAPDRADPVWAQSFERYQAALGNGDKYLLERSVAGGSALPVSIPRVLWRDEDRNGFSEEEYRYSGNRLVSWIRDSDEDGTSEVALTTEESGITLWYRRDRLVEAYSYRRYPRVDEIRRIRISEDSPGVDGAVVPESAEEVLRWIPPEPFDLALPLEVLRLDGTRIGLEEGIRRWGAPAEWIHETDRIVSTSDPMRSLDRQFRNASVLRDGTESRMRELGLLR